MLRRTEGRWLPGLNRRSLSWIAAGAACAAAVYAALATYAPERPDSAAICADRVKRIGLAILLYAQDHDERYPPARGWDHLVTPFIIGRHDTSLWRCPEGRADFGYAMNAGVALAPWARFADPHRTVSLLEADASRRDATGGARDLPARPRHHGSDVTGFADGHVRATPRADLLRMRWAP